MHYVVDELNNECAGPGSWDDAVQWKRELESKMPAEPAVMSMLYGQTYKIVSAMPESI